ncbi:MAG: methyltransferase domain-containing protein [Steroidobacteraceae bacterium]
MVVADVFGGGGYWSELFANVVGPNGKVLLVNNPPYADFAGKALGERLKDGRLPNVESRVATPADLRLGEGTLDAAVIFMSYHDLYYVDTDWPAIDAGQFLEQIRRAVKPGGAFLIVDHAAKDGSGKSAAQKLHRIDERFAKRDIERHGFRLEKTWDGLRVPADDRNLSVFDDKIRGRTDRFVHLYRRRWRPPARARCVRAARAARSRRRRGARRCATAPRDPGPRPRAAASARPSARDRTCGPLRAAGLQLDDQQRARGAGAAGVPAVS